MPQQHADKKVLQGKKHGSARWLMQVLLLQVHLLQVQTGVYLASSSQKFQRPIAGQQEIFGRSKKDEWTATQGVYFPARSTS